MKRRPAIAWWLAAALTGCGAAQHTQASRAPAAAPGPALAPATPPESSSAAPAPQAPGVMADPCEGSTGVLLLAQDVDATCKDGFRWCSAPVALEVRSCEPRPIVVERVELQSSSGGRMILEYEEPRLAYGDSRKRTLSSMTEGEYEARVVYTLDMDSSPRTALGHFRVSNSKRDAAKAACEACHGQWSSWGLSGSEGCNCRTKDGGKPCRDGDDCEGLCLFERFEVVQKPSGPVCGPGGCRASLGLGVPVGRCSEVRMLFGCRAIIGHGASKEPPRTLPGRAPAICVD